MNIRTRFAPSPTGFLHIGGARTALFSLLFAKVQNGKFILRIEDTDKERSKKEYETDILESLKWLGLNWDEGPEADGKYGPYRQSEKISVYSKYLQKLLDENKAYYCFCSEADLEAQRQYQMSIGEAPHYNGKCANLKREEIEKLKQEGKPPVIRFRVESKKVKFRDEIRGEIEFDAALFGDVVIAKNLNSPLYNFSVVIDDYEMQISHVIRGEEHLSNTPRQILFHEALNLPIPKYAHLPLILAPDRTKMSKRFGETAVLEYKKQGYLPEAIVNFIAFLGWNPGGEREIYSLASLAKEFSLERIQKGGAIFNIKRLDFINGFYIRQRSPEKITELCLPHLIEADLISPDFKNKQFPPAYGALEIVPIYKISETGQEIKLTTLQRIISLYRERLQKFSEIAELAEFFFKDKLEYDKTLLKWPPPKMAPLNRERASLLRSGSLAQPQVGGKEMSDSEIKNSLETLEKIFDKIKAGDWTKENLEKEILSEAEKEGDRGKLLWPMRAALTGKRASAGPFDVAAILGKEKSEKRIKEALRRIS
ncbi:MAG: glutamate--tRNA ligase [Patescibacteria group bacterium]